MAQAITVAGSPILSRLYTPADFGDLTLFMGIVSVAAGVAAAKFETAIVLPTKKTDALALVLLAMYIAAGTSVAIAIAVFFFSDFSQGHFTNNSVIYYAPATILLLTLVNILIYWHNRNKNFVLLSKAKVLQSSVLLLAQIILITAFEWHQGLVVAFFISQVFFFLATVKGVVTPYWRLIKAIEFKRLKSNFKSYKNFLVYYTPTALLDNLSLQAPVFFITEAYSQETLGLFGLTFRIINLPFVLISQAFSQVFYQHITEIRNNGGDVHAFIRKCLKKLIYVSIPFTVFFLVFSPKVFGFVFGQEWDTSGVYAQILIVPYAIRFITSPLSTALMVNNKLKVVSLWQVLYFASTVTVLYIGSHYSVYTLLLLFGANDILLYFIYLYLILKYSKNDVWNRGNSTVNE
ncbi:oligosaccharide flippase family protein [Rufibacter roseus]|uniref:Oligosaccharide flippase family protein n=1 Tax=Rufibacter roseus TaxID=1567108 RepID=A0ABW2DQH3_9BACT|nr:oligosaccharide flippase family protein [Rufibacter roseus]